MFYHASSVPNLAKLIPNVSNHYKLLVYLSEKRENTLVYLSNAIKKHCDKTGFEHNGKWRTWASYGFTDDKILRLDEYYPNATSDTYKNVSGYIYSIGELEKVSKQPDIPSAYTAEQELEVFNCEYVEDAYEALKKAAKEGKIVLTRYENNSPKMLDWIEKTVKEEYNNAENHPDYRHFLKDKFHFIK